MEQDIIVVMLISWVFLGEVCRFPLLRNALNIFLSFLCSTWSYWKHLQFCLSKFHKRFRHNDCEKSWNIIWIISISVLRANLCELAVWRALQDDKSHFSASALMVQHNFFMEVWDFYKCFKKKHLLIQLVKLNPWASLISSYFFFLPCIFSWRHVNMHRV